MRDKVFLLLLLMVCLFNIDYVYALDCDNEDIDRLMVLANNISYDYEYVGNIDFDNDYQKYKVVFSNIDKDVYVEYRNDIAYVGNDTIYVDSGKRNFRVYSSACETKLLTISVELPKFNERSLDEKCVFLAGDLDVCDMWYEGDISDSDFEDIINSYNSKNEEENESVSFVDNVINLIKRYYYIVIVVILLLILLVILAIRKHFKNKSFD